MKNKQGKRNPQYRARLLGALEGGGTAGLRRMVDAFRAEGATDHRIRDAFAPLRDLPEVATLYAELFPRRTAPGRRASVGVVLAPVHRNRVVATVDFAVDGKVERVRGVTASGVPYVLITPPGACADLSVSPDAQH